MEQDVFGFVATCSISDESDSSFSQLPVLPTQQEKETLLRRLCDMMLRLLLASLAVAAHSFSVPLAPGAVSSRAAAPAMFFGSKPKNEPSIKDAREADFQRRQDKLAQRKAGAAAVKGQVDVTFPQKGNKVVTAKQGEPLGKVISRAGLRVKFDCKNGRCATCQVRLNGRSTAKVCQGATIPGGATKKLSIVLDNP